MRRELVLSLRNGRVLAAYLRFGGRSGVAAARTERANHGMLTDYATDGNPIGVEFVAPTQFSLDALNELLASLGQEAATATEMWPLLNRVPDPDLELTWLGIGRKSQSWRPHSLEWSQRW